MNLNIILLLSIFVFFSKTLEVQTLKRIKRTYDLSSPDKGILQDFVTLRDEEKGLNILFKANNLKVLNASDSQNISKNISNHLSSDLKRNVGKPLAILLDERKIKFNDHEREDHKVAEKSSAALNSHIANHLAAHKVKESKTFINKFINADGKFREPYKRHKTKHSLHMLHSTGLVGARILIPPPAIRSAYKDFHSIASLEDLMNMKNLMMFKMGMDSLSHSPKVILAQNSPYLSENENFYDANNEPRVDYIFNSLEEPQRNYFNLQAPLHSNKPNFDDGFRTQAFIYKPSSVAIKEPRQLENLMQAAVETMLANTDDVEGGDKIEKEIELRCPIHHKKKNAQYEGDNGDVLKVCSCRFIKKTKEDRKQK